MKILFSLPLLAFALSCGLARADWIVRFVESPSGDKKVLSIQHLRKNTATSARMLRQFPYAVSETKLKSVKGQALARSLYREVLYPNARLPESLRAEAKKWVNFKQQSSDAAWPGSEVKTLVNQGPTANRINLTIVGDGYTESEKGRFFADAERITKDLFVGQAFASYLPLFNVFAVFVPSNESGLSDTSRKDTALSLYRDPPGSKRAIMPGDSASIERALALAPATDYPIVIANDDYYGGLGGRYAISTRSPTSGTVVLRHELGHNFGDVGEEYDGGSVYTGANFSSSSNVSWPQWVEGSLDVYNLAYLGGYYAWQNLKGRPYEATFKFPSKPALFGAKPFFGMSISAVGWQTPKDVVFSIDGKPVEIKGAYSSDRSFFEVGPATGLEGGSHRLRFEEAVNDGDNVLAYARLYAYPTDYDFTPGKIAAFANFNDDGRHVGYRPTHDRCLMRNMLYARFCPVDQENMWTRFLNRVDLIDGVRVEVGTRIVSLVAPKLKGLSVRWYVVEGGAEKEIEKLRDQLDWKAPDGLKAQMKVKAVFETTEVRKPTKRFVSEKAFSI